jgi:hypothetical protein
MTVDTCTVDALKEKKNIRTISVKVKKKKTVAMHIPHLIN